MKELKNKQIIIGLIALIILCILAIVLIFRRENSADTQKKGTDTQQNEYVAVEELPIADDEAMPEDLDGGFEDEANNPAVTSEIVMLDNLGIEPVQSVSGNYILDKDDPLQFHTEPVYKEYTGEDMWQLEEIYGYWSQSRLDAVDDLIHLPRVRTITNELSGTNYFYYYGEKDSKGRPNGQGLAVYADNAYYFGEWKAGKRSGMGRYWKTFPDKTGIINGAPGILEHQYNGMWANDYPNGEGHEHFTFDYDLIGGEYSIANVIGNFEDGYYDGELYIMTVVGDDKFLEWEAEAERGTYLHVDENPNILGKFKVWKRYNEVEDPNERYRLMYDEDNYGFGIYGLQMKD